MVAGITFMPARAEDSHEIGELVRPKFSYVDADEIYIEGGWYDIRGTNNKLVKINSQLKFKVGSAGSNSDSTNLSNAWHYIYVDYSAIPSTNILTAASFLNHTTAPTWNPAKGGWYGTAVGNLTVNDRCILGIYGDGTPNVVEFHHDGDTVLWADDVETQAAVDIDQTFTDIGALRIPGFATIGIVELLVSNATANTVYWRTKGQTGSTGQVAIPACDLTNIGNVSMEVITDGSQVIQIKNQKSDTYTTLCRTQGWKFPVGM